MQALAAGLRAIPGIKVPERVDTNILFFSISSADMRAAGFEAGMRERGVLLYRLGSRLRAVTHLDVSSEEVERAIGAARLVMDGRVA
jgi:threonine aldolase